MHVGLGDLDVMQPHDGIDIDRMGLGALAHELTMHLAFGRHVDDEIAANFRLTAEPSAVAQRAALVRIALLDRVPACDVVGGGDDLVLGEFAVGDVDLAAAADAASAADGIEINAELARGFEQADAVGDVPALARGGEYDAMKGQGLNPAPDDDLRDGRPRRLRPPAAVRDRR